MDITKDVLVGSRTRPDSIDPDEIVMSQCFTCEQDVYTTRESHDREYHKILCVECCTEEVKDTGGEFIMTEANRTRAREMGYSNSQIEEILSQIRKEMLSTSSLETKTIEMLMSTEHLFKDVPLPVALAIMVRFGMCIALKDEEFAKHYTEKTKDVLADILEDNVTGSFIEALRKCL